MGKKKLTQSQTFRVSVKRKANAARTFYCSPCVLRRIVQNFRWEVKKTNSFPSQVDHPPLMQIRPPLSRVIAVSENLKVAD